MQNGSKSFSKLVSVIVLCFLGGCCTTTQTTQTTKAVQKEVTVDYSGSCKVYSLWGCVGDKDCDCIPDKKDKCPMHKETYNGIDDQDGCPEKLIMIVPIDKTLRDSDNDGIPDDQDKCPFDAEDYDGVLDQDGRPDG